MWKKRALEAEELNRKFIADINGQTFMGEPSTTPSDIPKIGCVNHDCDKCKAAVQPLTGWQPIETAPKEELEPFLVFVPWDYIGDGVVIQVSMFEGRMFPDGKESCIDWNNAIINATHWMPLPEAPKEYV